jgi:predicted dehydrogenase
LPWRTKIARHFSPKLGVWARHFTTVMLPAICAPEMRVGVAWQTGAQHAASRFGFRYASSDEARILNDADINTVAI